MNHISYLLQFNLNDIFFRLSFIIILDLSISRRLCIFIQLLGVDTFLFFSIKLDNVSTYIMENALSWTTCKVMPHSIRCTICELRPHCQVTTTILFHVRIAKENSTNSTFSRSLENNVTCIMTRKSISTTYGPGYLSRPQSYKSWLTFVDKILENAKS